MTHILYIICTVLLYMYMNFFEAFYNFYDLLVKLCKHAQIFSFTIQEIGNWPCSVKIIKPSLLHVSAARGNLEVVKALLNLNADINIRDEVSKYC